MMVILWFWATVWDEPYRLETPGLQGMRRCLQPLRPGELSFPAGIPLDKSNNNNSNVSNNNSDDKSNHINNNSDWKSNSTFFFLWNLLFFIFFSGDLWNCHVEGRWFSSRFFSLNEDACKQVMWISMVYCFGLACIVRIFQIRVSKGFMNFSLLWLVALSSQQILLELETNLSSFLSTSHD